VWCGGGLVWKARALNRTQAGVNLKADATINEQIRKGIFSQK
jgi:hypothetical protein